MLISAVRQVVGLCSRYPWTVVVAAVIIATGASIYAATNFAITTDINKLISPDLEWRKRELSNEATFPGPFSSILVVVDAPTRELVVEASAKLAERLSQQ
jgi:predicted RND superfamily exporter protein